MKLQSSIITLVLCIIIVINFIPCMVYGIKVFRFQDNRKPTNESKACYQNVNNYTKMQSFSFCARFFQFCNHGRASIFTLTDELINDDVFRAEVWMDRLRVKVAQVFIFQELKEKLWIYRWYHLCFTYDHKNRELITYLNGHAIINKIVDAGRSIAGHHACLGQDIYSLPQRSYSGDITQVNVWDRVLTGYEVMNIAQCEQDQHGNYISWNNTWNRDYATSYNTSLADLCRNQNLPMYLWFPSKLYDTSMYLCPALGSHMPSGTDKQELIDIPKVAQQNFSDKHNCYTDQWIAVNDIKVEGKWMVGDTMVKEDMSWAEKEPNGGKFENCVSLEGDGLVDVSCENNWKCVVCIFEDLPRFKLLGTCGEELHSMNFMLLQHNVDEIQFQGYGHYDIKKNNGLWTLINVVKNVKSATLDSSFEYPMGRRPWHLLQPICGQSAGGVRQLLLTHCNSSQYTCSDASCIPLQNRCDMKYDCNDNSDEYDCQLVIFPRAYQKHLPPRNHINPESNLNIKFSLTVESICVTTMHMALEILYKLELMWADSRLQFRNLKLSDTLNILPESTMCDLWTPMVRIIQTVDNHRTITDNDTTMYVNRNGVSMGHNNSAAAEEELYPGCNNTLTSQRNYGTIFQCDFDFRMYPFDTQTCFMIFRIITASADFLVFDNMTSSVINNASTLLNEYQVGPLKLHHGVNDGYSEVKISVSLRRRYGYVILNVYIPSLVLLVVNYVTLFFHANMFELRVMSALTVQLVIATLFSQASASLPTVSYFKLVDVWLIFCVCITFLIIILHVLVQRDTDNPIQDNGSYFHSTTVNPSTLNQSTINQSTINQSPINKSVNHPLITRIYLYHSPVNQSTNNDSSVNWATNDHSTINQSQIDHPTVNRSLVNRLTINQLPVNHSGVNGSALNESVNQSVLNGSININHDSFLPCERVKGIFVANVKNLTGMLKKDIMMFSKVIVFLVFAVFNICYWSYIIVLI